MHSIFKRVFQQRFVHSSFRRSVAGIPEMVRAAMCLGRRSSPIGLPGSLVIRCVDGSVEQADLGPSVKDAQEVAVGHSQLASKPKQRPAMLGMSMADKVVDSELFLAGRERKVEGEIMGRQDGDARKLFPTYTHAAPAATGEVRINGKVLQLWTFSQLETLNQSALRKRALAIRDVIGEAACPPLPSGRCDDLTRWILQMQEQVTKEKPEQGRSGGYGTGHFVPRSFAQETKEMEQRQKVAGDLPTSRSMAEEVNASRDNYKDLKMQQNDFKEDPRLGIQTGRVGGEGKRHLFPKQNMVTHGVSAAEPQGIASLRATPEGRRYIPTVDNLMEQKRENEAVLPRGPQAKTEFQEGPRSNSADLQRRGCIRRCIWYHSQQPDSAIMLPYWLFAYCCQVVLTAGAFVFFLVLGTVLLLQSGSLQEVIVPYTANITEKEFSIDQAFEDDVLVYYDLSLLANHKSFAESKDRRIAYTFLSAATCTHADSRSWVRLRRGVDTTFLTKVEAADGDDLIPCGLVSLSMFTDNFTFYKDTNAGWERLDANESDIAIASDNEAYGKINSPLEGEERFYIEESDRRTQTWLTPSFFEHWKVWYRTPVSPHVRNLWAVIKGGLPQGSYKVQFQENSQIWHDWGVAEKRLILAQRNGLGNRGALAAMGGVAPRFGMTVSCCSCRGGGCFGGHAPVSTVLSLLQACGATRAPTSLTQRANLAREC
eukprot:s1503_g4.t1